MKECSKELGIPGIPNICESVQIARDVLLAEAAGCHYHVCHVSTKESVRVMTLNAQAFMLQLKLHHTIYC